MTDEQREKVVMRKMTDRVPDQNCRHDAQEIGYDEAVVRSFITSGLFAQENDVEQVK